MATYDRDDVLARVDLGELASELCGPPTAAGRMARWHCPSPDHPDVHPSMTIFQGPRSQRWKCHSCGEGGTAIDLWMLTQGGGVAAAIASLGEYAGAVARNSEESAAPRRARPVRSALPIADGAPNTEGAVGDTRVEAYVADAEAILWTPRGEGARRWLTERGLDEDVLRANRVGYDPGPTELRRPAGLPRRGVGIVLPVLGRRGQAVWFQTRYLDPAGAGRKYDNPVSEIAPNPRVAVMRTRDVDIGGPVVITEGIPDGLTAAHVVGMVAAIVGVSNHGPHVADQLVARFPAAGFVLVLDNDEPGRNGGSQLGAHLNVAGRAVMVTTPPAPHKDLNDWWCAARPDATDALVAASEPALEPVTLHGSARHQDIAASL